MIFKFQALLALYNSITPLLSVNLCALLSCLLPVKLITLAPFEEDISVKVGCIEEDSICNDTSNLFGGDKNTVMVVIAMMVVMVVTVVTSRALLSLRDFIRRRYRQFSSPQ